jgi:hypothetical protein
MQLRVVAATAEVRRVMELAGADGVLSLYPDLASALAGPASDGADPAGEGGPALGSSARRFYGCDARASR